MSIIGHDRQVQLLDLHARKGALSHAYLFTGPRHVGKMAIAQSLAFSILCKKRPSGALAFCGTCEVCESSTRGANPDITTEDIYSGERRREYISVEDVRRIRDRAARSAYAGKSIFFVRDAARLTREAANAFLKVLEEPRGDTIFLLMAETLDDVLPTIRSRSWILRFWPVSEELIMRHLLNTERMQENRARAIAMLCGGLPGQAIRFAKESEEALQKIAAERARVASFASAAMAERLRYADMLREDTEGMRMWYRERIAGLSAALHEALRANDGVNPVSLADMCGELLEGEERFSKPYAAKRVMFEATIIHV